VSQDEDRKLECDQPDQQIPERAVGGVGQTAGLEPELDEDDDAEEEHQDPRHQWDHRFPSP